MTTEFVCRQSQKVGTVMMGGTFNPVHHGHLRSAVDILDRFSFKELRLIPCYQPVHKGAPDVSALQRLHMTRLAVDADTRLVVDDREILREGPSYTIDTLRELRAELGEKEPLIMAVGMDSFLSLPTWHQWESIINIAHILVISRPGWDPDFISKLVDFYEKYRAESEAELQSAPAGKIWMESLTPLAISSSEIRTLRQKEYSIAYLVPAAVQRFIESENLYKGY